MNPAAGIVVLDGILHQICNRQRKLGLIDLTENRTEGLEDQLYSLLVRDRTNPVQNGFDQLIHIDRRDIHADSRLVHTNQREKVIDNLGLPVNFMTHILHEFLIELEGGSLHTVNGVRQDLHGSQRRLELMRDIGDELLPGSLHRLHAAQEIIEMACQLLRLRIV